MNPVNQALPGNINKDRKHTQFDHFQNKQIYRESGATPNNHWPTQSGKTV